MNKIIAVSALALTATLTAHAGGNASCSYGDKYMLGDGNIADRRASLQCSVSVNGQIAEDLSFADIVIAYGGIWNAMNFNNETDFGEETDLFGGLVFIKGNTTVDVGAQYFYLAPESIGDIVNVYGQITWETNQKILGATFTPSVKLDAYHSTDGSLDDGVLLRALPNLSWDATDSVAITVTPEIFYDFGPFGNKEGFVAQPKIKLEFDHGNGWSSGPEFKYALPFNDDDPRKGNNAYSYRVTYGF